MKQRLFIAAFAAALLFWHGSPALAQLQPVGAELCTLTGIGCPGPGGPAGPAGPSGPAGPAGSFNTSKVYVLSCPGTQVCACNVGDIAISGGGTCTIPNVLYQTSPQDGTTSSPPHRWVAQCLNTTTGDGDIAGTLVYVVCASP